MPAESVVSLEPTEAKQGVGWRSQLPGKPGLHLFQEGKVAGRFDPARQEGLHAADFAGCQGVLVAGSPYDGPLGSLAHALGHRTRSILDGHIPVAATFSRKLELDHSIDTSRPFGPKRCRHGLDQVSGCHVVQRNGLPLSLGFGSGHMAACTRALLTFAFVDKRDPGRPARPKAGLRQLNASSTILPHSAYRGNAASAGLIAGARCG
jgi:hypothetical protein